MQVCAILYLYGNVVNVPHDPILQKCMGRTCSMPNAVPILKGYFEAIGKYSQAEPRLSYLHYRISNVVAWLLPVSVLMLSGRTGRLY